MDDRMRQALMQQQAMQGGMPMLDQQAEALRMQNMMLKREARIIGINTVAQMTATGGWIVNDTADLLTKAREIASFINGD